MIFTKNLHWLIYILFVLGCARQTSPTGGPKDTIPPALLSSIPKNGQTNFKGKTLELTFSETVIVTNPKEQLIITPSLTKPVDLKARKNQVILTIQEELQDSTTYSINFREAVQDITEKNPAQMLKLAFSTGSYIDSLSIEGKAFDPLKNKDIKDATVALYQTDTFDIFKHRPTYITRSDAKGNFKIENLKPGKYFIYGIEDKNKNLIVDSKTEAYGFLRDSIALTNKVKNVKLPLIHLDSRPLKLTSARPYGTYYNIKTTKNLTFYKLTTTEDEHLISSFGEDLANIRVYNTFQDKDSVSVRFSAIDSINNSLDTTLFVKFSDRQVKPDVFEFKLDNFQVIAAKGTIRGTLTFNKPILDTNFDSIYYAIDSVQRISFTHEDLHWDSLHNTLTVEKSFDKNLLPKEIDPEKKPVQQRMPQQSQSPKQREKPSLQNLLYLGKSAFVSIELDSTKQLSETLPPIKLEDTGIILIEVQTTAPSFIVQLLTKDFKLLASRRNIRKFNFEDLKPGDYQLRLVIDENDNGQWDPGNFYKHQEPEKIFYYTNEKSNPVVTLKANWELGPLLIKH